MEKRDQSRLFLRQNRQKSAKQKNPSVTGHVFPNRQDFFFEKLVCVRNFEGGFFVKKKRKIPRPDRRGAACRSRKSVPVTEKRAGHGKARRSRCLGAIQNAT